MHLQLITPEKILFEGEASYIQIPGSEGEFGVLSGHAPTIATLKEGIVGIEMASGQKQEFPVYGGVAEVTPDHVTLLVEV